MLLAAIRMSKEIGIKFDRINMEETREVTDEKLEKYFAITGEALGKVKIVRYGLLL